MNAVSVTRAGVYQIPEAAYHDDPVPGGSLSCSGAKLLLPPSCPARYQWARKQPRQPTRAMEFGTAAHREVLGAGWPLAVADPAWADWTANAAQSWRKEQRAAGKVPVLAREHETIKAMAAVIAAHPTARLLLQAEEIYPEHAMFWADEETGIWRRARMDAVRLRGRVIIADYKTAVSADPEEFARAAARLRYHMQDPWYRDAVTRTLGDADPAFLFIVQEKDPPYLVAVYELEPSGVEAGRERNRRACRIYARCVAAGEWPGHQLAGETVTTISLPRWGL